jgi:hypothetical protein
LRDTIINLGGDGYYYMTGSSGDNIWDVTSGIELWRSKDLQQWDYVGLVWSFVKDATWEKMRVMSGRRKFIMSGAITISPTASPAAPVGAPAFSKAAPANRRGRTLMRWPAAPASVAELMPPCLQTMTTRFISRVVAAVRFAKCCPT